VKTFAFYHPNLPYNLRTCFEYIFICVPDTHIYVVLWWIHSYMSSGFYIFVWKERNKRT